MSKSGIPSQEDLKEYATRLEADYEKSETKSASSLRESLNGLEKLLNASMRRQKRFEQKLAKAARRYADAQTAAIEEKLTTQNKEISEAWLRLSQIESQLCELESSSESEASAIESRIRSRIESEVTELIEENGSLREENARLRARAESAESELERAYAIQSEIIELMKEKLPDLYQEFLKRSNA